MLPHVIASCLRLLLDVVKRHEHIHTDKKWMMWSGANYEGILNLHITADS